MAREPIGGGLNGFIQAIGLSTITGITGLPGQLAMSFRVLSGGTLEIGGASLTWGQGCVLSNSAAVVYPFNVSGTFYVAATGSTVLVCGVRTISTPELTS